jgi:uncharacterized protein YgiM (DUF1202 family)
LRCGPSEAWKELSTARAGDRLVVLEERIGWLRVKPPGGLTCWISSKYVKKVEDGSGFVTGDKVNLRITPDADPTTAIYPIGQAAIGERVNILEEIPGWVRIQAYDRVGCWIRKELVKYIESYTPSAQDRMDEEAAKRHTLKARQLELRKKLAEAEELMRAEYAKPIMEQDFASIVAMLAEVQKDIETPALKDAANRRLNQLTERQNAIEELKGLVAEKDAALKEAENKLIQKLEEESAAARKPEYTAQGWVDGVGRLIGRPGSHKLLQGGRIIFFLKTDKFDLNAYLGKLVGVRGTIHEAPGWEWKVIEIDELEDLTPR